MFSKKDRRADYKKRHAEMGLCRDCASPSLPRHNQCFRHSLFHRINKAGLLRGQLGVKHRNQRERFNASLFGRYQAILNGHLKPADAEQALKDAAELRARLGILWGGVRGLKKTAVIIQALDRHAAKSRKGD